MQLDIAASNAIYEELKVIRTSGVEQATEDMILNVLKMGVASARSEEGKLYVTGIDGALSSVREGSPVAARPIFPDEQMQPCLRQEPLRAAQRFPYIPTVVKRIHSLKLRMPLLQEICPVRYSLMRNPVS